MAPCTSRNGPWVGEALYSAELISLSAVRRAEFTTAFCAVAFDMARAIEIAPTISDRMLQALRSRSCRGPSRLFAIRAAQAASLRSYVARVDAPARPTSTQRRRRAPFAGVRNMEMGTDALAVVDGRLKVYGINGLRIADASIMPG